MKILVIGLGSMGKRRVRNLLSLGIKNIYGFDPKESRRKEATEKYGISCFENVLDAINLISPNALVISTPPDKHMEYAYLGLEKNLHCFIEASVTDKEKILKLAQLTSQNNNLIFAPSCTMSFFSGPQKIAELLEQGVVGKMLNFNYHVGQYLPDWHPWEKIEDYYVSKRETGGAREIVPFELTWLYKIFGKASAHACFKSKLTDLNADIDDLYHCLLKFPNNVVGNLTVEVISRPSNTRVMRIIGSEGILEYNSDQNQIKVINLKNSEWKYFSLESGTIEKQYIYPEQPYIKEMNLFLTAIAENNPAIFPNTLLEDYEILNTLTELEAISL